MGTLFRAAAGFAIALTLLHGTGIWSGLKTPQMRNVEAEIAATHPADRLEATLNNLLVPRNGTVTLPKTPDGQARGLHF